MYKTKYIRKSLLAMALLVGGQSAHASHLITEISFSGTGSVISSDGIDAPSIGTKNNIQALISFRETPYIDEYASGTYFLYTSFATGESGFRDSFIGTLPCRSYCSGWLTLDHGKLVDFYLVSIFYDDQILQLRPGQFDGFFLSYDESGHPFEGNFYAGNWAMGPIRITTDAIPEPANWALMITGFAMVGSTLRTRRTARPIDKPTKL